MKGVLFTYILTYGGAVASLLNPWYGLLIYFIFANIKPESMWYWSVPAGNYSRIVAIALLVGWALQSFGNWDFGRARPIVYLLLGFWIWALISAWFAPIPELGFRFVEAKFKVFLPFLVAVTLIDSVEKVKQLAWVLVLSEGYVAYEMNYSFYFGGNRLRDLGFGGMDNNSAATGLVACVGLAFFTGIREERISLRLVAFAIAALCAHCCMFAFSRGAMLSLCVTAVVAFVLLPKRPQHYLYFVLAAALAFRLAGPEVMDRFMSAFVEAEDRDASAQSRVELWAASWDMMVQNPLFGVGPDHFGRVIPQYGFSDNKAAHSTWMQTGAELGFPGLGLLVGFYFASIWLAWELLRRDSNEYSWFAGSARMVIASTSGFMVAACFVTMSGLEFPYYVALLGVGAVKLQDSQAQSHLQPYLTQHLVAQSQPVLPLH